MRGKIRWRCSRDVFSELPGKLNPCKPLLKCMHSRYCHCGPERGLSHSRGVPCAPRQEDAGPTQGQHNGTEPKFAVSSHKPDGALESELAVLVYRLVCQPVTLESWVRLPDAALDRLRSRARPATGAEQAQTDCGQTRPQSFFCRTFRFFCKEFVYHSSIISAFCGIDHKTQTF